MGRREQRRYRELERYATYALAGEAVVFFLYLLCAGFGVGWLKIFLAVVAILAAGLGIAYLYLIGELLRPRSRWMGTGFAAVIACILVSLLLNYPSPSPLRSNNIKNPASNAGAGQSSNTQTGPSTGATTAPSDATDPSDNQSDDADTSTAPSGTDTEPASVFYFADSFSL